MAVNATPPPWGRPQEKVKIAQPRTWHYRESRRKRAPRRDDRRFNRPDLPHVGGLAVPFPVADSKQMPGYLHPKRALHAISQ